MGMEWMDGAGEWWMEIGGEWGRNGNVNDGD